METAVWFIIGYLMGVTATLLGVFLQHKGK